MDGHHLILGKIKDVLTGKVIDDTHDERYRQKIAKLLIERKGYAAKDISAGWELVASAGDKKAKIKIDFAVRMDEKIGMVIKYGPGSLVTRHRPALAAGRLVALYQVPVVVVTNGEDADVLAGSSGRRVASGVAAIPSKDALSRMASDWGFPPVTRKRAEIESRILYAYEVDGSCPCDDTICRM